MVKIPIYWEKDNVIYPDIFIREWFFKTLVLLRYLLLLFSQ